MKILNREGPPDEPGAFENVRNGFYEVWSRVSDNPRHPLEVILASSTALSKDHFLNLIGQANYIHDNSLCVDKNVSIH